MFWKWIWDRTRTWDTYSRRGSYSAGFIAIAAFMPATLTVLTMGVFIGRYPDERALLVGAAITSLIWALAPILVRFYTSLENANATSYRELVRRVDAAGKVLGAYTSNDYPSLHPAQLAALIEAREHVRALRGLIDGKDREDKSPKDKESSQ